MILPALQNQDDAARLRNAPPVEVAHVRAFVEAAHVGRRGVVLPGFDTPTEGPSGVSEVEFGCRSYGWNGTTTYIDVRTRSIVAYDDDRDEAVFGNERYGKAAADRLAPRRVSDAEAVELARRFHEATHSPYGILPWDVRDHQGSRNNRLSISLTATWRGVPYDRELGGDLEIGRDDGCLRSYGLYALAKPLPKPPDSLVPQVSVGPARLVALRSLTRRKGIALSENPKWPFALAIGSPAAQDMSGAGIFSFLTPNEAARVAAGEGRLVYSGQFVGGDPDDEHVPRLNVMIDALDGRVLYVRDWGFGRGGPGAKGIGKPLLPPMTARAWCVAVGEGDWSLPAKAILVAVDVLAPKGTKVTLSDGKAAFPANYDAKANLLGIAGKAYRPGPALAALLKRRTR